MPPSALRLHAATALVSGTVLLLETLYTRLFSFAIWYHFAYATIALALLGFGASGALLATRPTLPGPRAALRAGQAAALAGAGAWLGLAVVVVTPSDPFRLAQDPWQVLLLGLDALAVVVPFTAAGGAIAAVLAAFPARAGSLYAANLAGAGLGALAAGPVLGLVPPLLGLLLGLPALARSAVVLGLVAPLAAVLGSFFPLGLRALPDGRLVAWAWAVNGCANVIGASLAIVGAMSGGFGAVALGALAVYGAGVLVLPARATEA